MVQSITPDLTALLKSNLQVGGDGFRGRLEVDYVIGATAPGASPALVQSVAGRAVGTADLFLPADVTPDNVLLYPIVKSKSGDPQAPYTGVINHNLGGPAAWSQFGSLDRTGASGDMWTAAMFGKVANGSDPISQNFSGGYSTCGIFELAGVTLVGATVLEPSGIPGASADLDLGSFGTPAAGLIAVMIVAQYTPDIGTMSFDPMGWTTDDENVTANFGDPRPFWVGHKITDGSPLEAQIGSSVSYPWTGIAILLQPSSTGSDATYGTRSFPVTRMSLDRSRKMAAAQLDADLTNELDTLGYYQDVDRVLAPNNPIRAYMWYGDVANQVQVFAGLIDRDHEHRDPKSVSVKARSRMKWLLEQSAWYVTAPQSADETGAVRTEDNGVYLNQQISDIVTDILDRWGWPAADRDITATSYILPEFVIESTDNAATAISGTDKLADLVGYDFWEDELGVIHFGPNALTDSSEPAADYTFEAGVDILTFDHEVDDEDRATRVQVTGPLTSDVPIWKQEWSTSVLRHPTGVMYVPSQSGYIYAIDALTQYLSKIRQSDRVVVARWYLGGSITYKPIGLTVDVSAGTFYVLDSGWSFGGSTSVHIQKYDLGTKAHLATYSSLPAGQWSAIKTDGSNLWLTNYGNDKLYKRTMTGGSSASYSYTGKTNPTGLYIDGTTIGLRFASATTGAERFYLVSTSAPGTITGTQSTKGTNIFGGEMDTTTHNDLYVDFYNSSAGYIYKFALTEEVTTDVVVWATDQALEDALGFQSGIANRIHDLHTGAAAHPWEVRIASHAMTVVNSVAQAQETADALLSFLSRLRRVLDVAWLGNPAVQINDVIAISDPVSGVQTTWLLDTYRSEMDASGTYTGSGSLLPWEAP